MLVLDIPIKKGPTYKVSKHFILQFVKRTGLKYNNAKFIKNIQKSIRSSYWVQRGPSSAVHAILNNNFHEARYFYNPSADMVFVLEREGDKVTGPFNVLVTFYKGSDSSWIPDWKRKTPNEKRISWETYIEKGEDAFQLL